jgi:peptidoglycan/xylan/chitin deacetylase (PgdA/CDA1 family)
MLIAVLVALGAVATLAHIAPFRFVLDAAHGSGAVWRMPASGSSKPVYLTFDDGPNPTATPELLDVLKEKNARATFFLIDDYVNQETAPIVRRMFAEGHGVAQHTGRRWLLLRSPSHVAEMLEAGAQKIERLAGDRPCRLFRPHAGWRSAALFAGARRAGYTVAGWSWMSWDWVGFRERTGARVAQQLIAHAAPGKIMVIHDGHHKNARADRRYAIDATTRIIDTLRQSGYTFEALCGGQGHLGHADLSSHGEK